ncbi:gamma-type small acid-soluble spore protein [Pullulanibacillus sp. KACC 23026]|uniref:gamma-type small acid-soluble spore protein n=1 Tax=Pullulanibacillus sp. KACC 23026 TaxID=3028315 RepID=UPI0023B18C34|nr:gamma-type small acid-soluble spore protein [Pullulanibacillus sp. KACC 23026]WEG12272.1 gamma-type small acid-soluble spore protein [Pullulanibacillus sp. KACC 23026]
MAKKTKAGTNVEEVKRQNQQSASGSSSSEFGAEFGSETNAQEVRKQNNKSQKNKGM